MIGSGVEHMGHLSFGDVAKTQQDYGQAFTPQLMAKHNIVGQGLGAEMIADQWEIPRSELDELALRSHKLAHQATEEGRFEREMLPMSVNGDTFVTDQGIRPDTSLEALSQLKPVFKEDGKITAGNSSQISDGAAAVLLMSADKAKALGLKARARIVDQTTVGTDPVKMLEGPIPATARILQRNGMSIDDIDLFEINEAFAPVVAAWRREHNPDMDRVNGHGRQREQRLPGGSVGAAAGRDAVGALEGGQVGGGAGAEDARGRLCRLGAREVLLQPQHLVAFGAGGQFGVSPVRDHARQRHERGGQGGPAAGRGFLPVPEGHAGRSAVDGLLAKAPQ